MISFFFLPTPTADETELSFDPGDVITNIEKIDDVSSKLDSPFVVAVVVVALAPLVSPSFHARCRHRLSRPDAWG